MKLSNVAVRDFLQDAMNCIQDTLAISDENEVDVEFEDCLIRRSDLEKLYEDCDRLLKGEEVKKVRVPAELLLVSDEWINIVRLINN